MEGCYAVFLITLDFFATGAAAAGAVDGPHAVEVFRELDGRVGLAESEGTEHGAGKGGTTKNGFHAELQGVVARRAQRQPLGVRGSAEVRYAR